MHTQKHTAEISNLSTASFISKLRKLQTAIEATKPFVEEDPKVSSCSWDTELIVLLQIQ